MKIQTMKLATFALAGLLFAGGTSPLGAVALAQEKDKQKSEQKTRPRTATTTTTTTAAPAPSDAAKRAGERLEPDDTSAPPRSDMSPEMQANRRETLSEEEAAVVPYYNNFMSSYRLGPEDVISITVFNLDRYSKAGIVIPPDAIISHPLIPEGVHVAGKTTKQVADEITKKLDEYVIAPKVTVSLDKAQSAVFWVVGDVGQPGIRPMTRRLSLTEALALSGGVLPTGNKKKVAIMRRQANGFMQPTIIDVAAIEKGKMPDNYFLNPGDQIIVPGNRLKTFNQVLSLLPVVSFFRIFTGGF
ncbi:MAG TPA: polysaccharide biosynthesis/export family protein [Pyrinomonadaceae bacterium]|jgi:polysaccharide export outer membrane protein|nr:polysaccharide biosynthesis/export family protein [Pyrinomonadaceae bacterium]